VTVGHRFFLDPAAWCGETVHFDAALAHQLRNVLRLRPGARVTALDGTGVEYQVELTRVERDAAVGWVLSRRAAQGEPSVEVVLYQSMLKADRFEWVLQKGTELGVTAFVPTISARTVRREAARVEKKRDRWERIVREAAEQSGRGRLPELRAALELGQACVQAAAESDLALIPWAEAAAPGILAAVRDRVPRPDHVALLIGPEGGYAQHEVDAARQAGVQPVTMGPRILRAETAGVVAAALVLAGLGEMA
jgi:16S rRNA (uracil1498-N3)-methyltransferase